VVAKQLEDWGIAHDRIVVEDRALNTRDNAVESARIVRERGWRDVLIVTSAHHMPRALECFNAVGLPVDTMPVDFRSYDASGVSSTWMPRSGALNQSTSAIRELVGRVVYRVQGYATQTPPPRG
jgi:uncharacterized SAM-binding protein YcdF (DUF218 family)